MNLKSICALLAILALGCGLAFAHVISWSTLALLLPVIGTVTVTYEYPVASTTAPTTTQSALVKMVTANIIASADGDTTATVTHNLQISTADRAKGFPIVILTPLLSQALTALSAWTATITDGNVVTLTKLTSTGSGNASPQLRITVMRPWTAMQ